jgi:hypothetical protein
VVLVVAVVCVLVMCLAAGALQAAAAIPVIVMLLLLLLLVAMLRRHSNHCMVLMAVAVATTPSSMHVLLILLPLSRSLLSHIAVCCSTIVCVPLLLRVRLMVVSVLGGTHNTSICMRAACTALAVVSMAAVLVCSSCMVSCP